MLNFTKKNLLLQHPLHLLFKSIGRIRKKFIFQSSEEIFTLIPRTTENNNLQETNITYNDLVRGENTDSDDHFPGEHSASNAKV